MLVSSIGYFNQQNASLRDYSTKNQMAKSNMQAGFGHVNEVNVQQDKNIFSRITQSIMSLFSDNKSEQSSKKVSYIA